MGEAIVANHSDVKKIFVGKENEINLETILNIAHLDNLNLAKKFIQAILNQVNNYGSEVNY